jgi:hypothetical protein
MIVFSHYGERPSGGQAGRAIGVARQAPLFGTRTVITTVADQPKMIATGTPGVKPPAPVPLLDGTPLQISIALESFGLKPRDAKYKEPDPAFLYSILEELRTALGIPDPKVDPLSMRKVIDLVMRRSPRIRDFITAVYNDPATESIPIWFPDQPPKYTSTGSSQSALTSGDGGTRPDEQKPSDPYYPPEEEKKAAFSPIEWVKENPGKAAGVGAAGVMLLGGIVYLLKR